MCREEPPRCREGSDFPWISLANTRTLASGYEDEDRASDDGMPEAPASYKLISTEMPSATGYVHTFNSPQSAQARKDTPITTGVLDYFPDALLEVARVSKIGNDQHNPGEPLHWAKEKSKDEADALVRHLLDRGTLDTDGTRHTAKVAWRALALLQRELDAEKGRR